MFNVLKIYHLFISHSWSYSPHYNTLLEWIDRSNIVFSNYSVPYTDPFTGKTKAQLQEAITEQIRHSSIVIIAAGMYVSYSAWIDYEIRTACIKSKKRRTNRLFCRAAQDITSSCKFLLVR